MKIKVMNKKQLISVLPNHIINQIAAGEVVERPASVLKELLDNSIDAGSQHIKIHIEEGGTKSIKVIDDGSGMSVEDAKTAFLPHSTSKIKTEEDLSNIMTLGFRGEALASIASISKIELITKNEDSVSGFKINIEGGKIIEEKEVGATTGTSILVKDIFFNTPARRKFLKTTSTELRNVIKIFTELALANPQIGFEFHHNNKQLFALPKLDINSKSDADNLGERIRNLIGDDFINNSFEIFYDGIIKISGFAGLPKIGTSRKSTQIVFVNGRPITNPTVFAAVKDAYHTAMPKNLYPQFVMNILLDPKKVDVNVHPRKLEVRFSEQQVIYKAVKYAIIAGLEKTLKKDTLDKLGSNDDLANFPKSIDDFSNNAPKNTSRGDGNYPNKSTTYVDPKSVTNSLNFTKSLLKESDEKPLPWENKEDIQEDKLNFDYEIPDSDKHPAYQLLNAYIITSNGSSIQIIDQHAASERVTYEKLVQDFENSSIQTQALLIPFEIDLNTQESIVLSENIELFKSYGIEIEKFGPKSYVIREIPIELKDADLSLLIKELLNELANNEHDIKTNVDTIKENMIITLACHSSIRVGDKLKSEEVEKLISDLKKCRLPYSCPHGRPIIYEVPISELEKKFKRK